MIAVVTGAGGHVGAALVRALLGEGHHVRALVRSDDRALAGLDVERIRGDLGDLGALARACDRADQVFHCAARISLRSGEDAATEQVNVGGTQAVVDACLRAGVARLIHVSSVNALRQDPRRSLDEDFALADHPGAFPYDGSKARAERVVLAAAAADLDAVIVNPAAVIGPYDFKPSRMGEFFLRLRDGRIPALVAGSQSWVDVRDVAMGAILAARRGRRGERYLLGGHQLPIAELAAMAAAIGGFRRPRVILPVGLFRPFAPLAERVSVRLGVEPVVS
ncbi:MAG TPA: NAD-dependent epimerase/dehydratase family protein, partial [Nannocystaceae bacterium]|nr:NAD-dependent epimerase/dehydratase family protein [Nannocystaceae bacterium]